MTKALNCEVMRSRRRNLDARRMEKRDALSSFKRISDHEDSEGNAILRECFFSDSFANQRVDGRMIEFVGRK